MSDETNARQDIIAGASAELYRRMEDENIETRDLALCLIAHELGALNYKLSDGALGSGGVLEEIYNALKDINVQMGGDY